MYNNPSPANCQPTVADIIYFFGQAVRKGLPKRNLLNIFLFSSSLPKASHTLLEEKKKISLNFDKFYCIFHSPHLKYYFLY